MGSSPLTNDPSGIGDPLPTDPLPSLSTIILIGTIPCLFNAVADVAVTAATIAATAVAAATPNTT